MSLGSGAHARHGRSAPHGPECRLKVGECSRGQTGSLCLLALGFIYPGGVYQSMKTNSPFGLWLFLADPDFIPAAIRAGVTGVVVDWERAGKERRQSFADTQINEHGVDDLRRVRSLTEAPILCRINALSSTSQEEIDLAIEAGASEVLLPMAQSLDEVKSFLEMVAGRCGPGILIETLAATRIAAELAKLPLARVFVGLNDLALDRGLNNIFDSLADGTVERVRRHFQVPFGVGGLTLPDRGYPIPCRLLMGEMARLRCDFSFLRRSFYADIQGRDVGREVPRMQSALREAFHRPPEKVKEERAELLAAIASWSGHLRKKKDDEPLEKCELKPH